MGTCLRHFLQTVGIYSAISPTFFCSGFVIGELSKIKVTFVTLREELFMLDVTHSQVDVEAEFGVVSLILVFYKF